MHHAGYFSAVLLISLLFFLSCGCLHSGDESRDWNSKGETYHSLGRYEEAVGAFDKAVAINPENGEAWRNRGLSLSQLNRSSEAEESFSRALAIDPADSEAWYFRALSLEDEGNLTCALESADRAVTMTPENRDEAILLSNAWTLRGDLLVKMNRRQEANESYQRANEILMSTL